MNFSRKMTKNVFGKSGNLKQVTVIKMKDLDVGAAKNRQIKRKQYNMSMQIH